MIVVDTCVWVEANRRPVGPVPNALRSLLEADELALALPVRLELVSGVARKDRRALVHGLSGLPVVVPTEDTWKLMESWIPLAADKGHRFALSDLMIAALAHEIGALVWSLDDDFGRMAQLGMIQTYAAV